LDYWCDNQCLTSLVDTIDQFFLLRFHFFDNGFLEKLSNDSFFFKSSMVKIGVVQTSAFSTNHEGILKISKDLEKMGKNEVDIVCLPEQWLPNNFIIDFNKEFLQFKQISKEFGFTIIPGAFFQKKKNITKILAPIIGPNGDILGAQAKIHPYDYENTSVKPGNEAMIFKTICNFGIIICYDMVFPNVAQTMAKKGAQLLFSPSRIVKAGIEPWKMYVQVRALENRIPIVGANVQDKKFGGNSIIVNMKEKNKIVKTQLTTTSKNGIIIKNLDLKEMDRLRKKRFSDFKKFT
jgi:omega-amidase